MRLKRLAKRVCTPDELDMIEHYRTDAEKTADLFCLLVNQMSEVYGVLNNRG